MSRTKKIPLREFPEPGRVCWLCEHVLYLQADAGYSEYTPGSDFTLRCNQGYWDFDAFDDGLKEFREKLMTAERCADFEKREAEAQS